MNDKMTAPMPPETPQMIENFPKASTMKWTDLRTRILSAVVMLAIGAFAVLGGDIPFVAVTVIVIAISMIELTRMGKRRASSGEFGFLDFFLLSGYALFILLAGLGIIVVYMLLGVGVVLALFTLVVAVDSFGYIFGRALGGPKFWKAVSPSKTWSGTLAGWGIGAISAILYFMITNSGAEFSSNTLIRTALIGLLFAIASQSGDLIESALKRRMGVKDSSKIIPGHGGVLDRFDGFFAASFLAFMMTLIVYVPS